MLQSYNKAYLITQFTHKEELWQIIKTSVLYKQVLKRL